MASVTPYVLAELLGDHGRFRPSSLFDQHFGLGILSDDLFHPQITTVPLVSGYYRPWRHQATRHSGVSNLQDNAEGFKANLDVQQFKPDEVSVKVDDNFIVVEGKHEEREDEHGFISRQFQRRYQIPSDVDPDTVTSKLSSDGILTIEASKKVVKPANTERVITIIHTNAPALSGGKSGQGDMKEKSETEEKMDQ